MKLELSQQHRDNLAKLADVLSDKDQVKKLTGGFNMRAFASRWDSRLNRTKLIPLPSRNVCGTVCCAIGVGSLLMIPQEPDMEWLEYTATTYGINYDGSYDGSPDRDPQERRAHQEAFEWMFGEDWEYRDNTPEGAAKRIKYFLEHGVPKDWKDMLYEHADLCY